MMKGLNLFGAVSSLAVSLFLSGNGYGTSGSQEEGDTPSSHNHSPGNTSPLNQDKINDPLHQAVLNGDINLATTLLQESSDFKFGSSDGLRLLLVAANKGHKEIAELLLKNGVTVDHKDPRGWTALMVAADKGHNETVELLINKGANIHLQDSEVWTALMFAAQKDHKETVELLLKSGANVDDKNSNGTTALMIAVDKGHKVIAELLLKNGANINLQDSECRTALMISAYHGHKVIAELLLNKGANIDLKDSEGWTALMVVAYRGNKEIAELLINKGANIDLKDSKDRTALMNAAYQGHKETVELLINKGANIDLKDSKGRTALRKAIEQGHNEIAELLIEKGTNLDYKDSENGNTPLHAAVMGENKVFFEFILSKSLKLNIRNNAGETPLYLALVHRHADFAKTLLKAGAKAAEVPKNLQESMAKFATDLGLYGEVFPEKYKATLAELEGEFEEQQGKGKGKKNKGKEKGSPPTTPQKAGPSPKASHEAGPSQPVLKPLETPEQLADFRYALVSGSKGEVQGYAQWQDHLEDKVNGKTVLQELFEKQSAMTADQGQEQEAIRKTIRVLVELGASLEAPLNKEHTLFTAIATLPNTKKTPGGQAEFERNRISNLIFLHELRANPDVLINGDTLLRTAANVQDINLMKILTFLGADPQAQCADGKPAYFGLPEKNRKGFLNFYQNHFERVSSNPIPEKEWPFHGEAPESMTCTMTQKFMRVPVKIEGTDLVVEYSALIRSCMQGGWFNPYTREPVRMSMLTVQKELQEEIMKHYDQMKTPKTSSKKKKK